MIAASLAAPDPASADQAAFSSAAPHAQLTAAFEPKLLGKPTSVSFAIRLGDQTVSTLSPLSELDVSYPGDLGFATSGLGLASCEPARLEALGAAACPPNSKVGSGTATAAVAFGPDLVSERVALQLFAGPSPDGYLHLLVLASGAEPVEAKVILTGLLLPGHLQLTVPAVPGLPGAPDVALTDIRARVGGPLVYYERIHHRTVAYHPHGIGLPDSCPQGGWKLGAQLAFEDGRSSSASTVISCPRQRH